MNRLGQFLPPPDGPDPKGNKRAPEGGAMPDLSRESLEARGGTDGSAEKDPPKPDKPDLSKAALPGQPSSVDPEAVPGPEESLARLQEIRARQVAEMEAGRRAALSGGDIETLVQAAHAIRSQEDQSQAPPVDYELVRQAIWGLLPRDKSIEVRVLGLSYKTWGEAIAAEQIKRYEAERAAESN